MDICTNMIAQRTVLSMLHPGQNLLDIPMKNSLRKSNRERLCWNSTEFLRIYSLLRHIPMMKIH